MKKKMTNGDHLSSFDLTPVTNPCTSEKCNDSEDENLQLQAIHEIYLSVIKQSLNDSISDPSFFKDTSKFNE